MENLIDVIESVNAAREVFSKIENRLIAAINGAVISLDYDVYTAVSGIVATENNFQSADKLTTREKVIAKLNLNKTILTVDDEGRVSSCTLSFDDKSTIDFYASQVFFISNKIILPFKVYVSGEMMTANIELKFSEKDFKRFFDIDDIAEKIYTNYDNCTLDFYNKIKRASVITRKIDELRNELKK